MSNYGGGNKPAFKAREKSILSDYNLNVPGPVQNGSNFPSEFRMAHVPSSNSIAIQIETKVKDAKNYGRYEVVVPYMSAIGMVETVKMLINDPTINKAAYRVKDFVFFGGGKSDEPKVKATLTVGRDNEGCMYMGLSGKDIQPIKFVFALSKYDEIVIGETETAAATSVFAAKVFCTAFGGLLPIVMAIGYKEPEKKEKPAGGNGGGNSYGGGNRGGNSGGGNSGSFDNDLPF